MGGLVAALRLAAAGVPVLVVDMADAPGGKLREVEAGGLFFDAGPTVFTMKWVFDDLLAPLGKSLDQVLELDRAETIARHYWADGAVLDLYSDLEANLQAIGEFAGKENAEGYRRFAADSARVFKLLKSSFIDAEQPNPLSLSRRVGLSRPGDLLALKPFSTLWSALEGYFPDPRLRQLFGRYATYCGSSPYAAPATLMLVAHVEQAGVWIVRNGMHALARCLESLAVSYGAEFRYGAQITRITADTTAKKVTGVELSNGEWLHASSLVFNGDAAAVPSLIDPAAQARADKKLQGKRSQSALVVCGPAKAEGVPLAHHTVFFSNAYEAEFNAVFKRSAAPSDPTIYICAPDRSAAGALAPERVGQGRERIYGLINLPPDGDRHTYSQSELDACLNAMDRRLAANGLTLTWDRQEQVLTAPDGFARLFPQTGGALYGQASHGWMASFSRPGARGALQGLYLAGGSVHPGPGVPMAALSGKIAADRLMKDLALKPRFRPAATGGGTPTASATAASTPLP